MSLAFIRQCQHYGPVSCIWTPLLIPLGMKWIQWGVTWPILLPFLFCIITLLCPWLFLVPCFYQHNFFLKFGTARFSTYVLTLPMFKLWKKRIKEYVMCSRTTYYCISFIFLLYDFLNYMLFVPSNPLSLSSHHG